MNNSKFVIDNALTDEPKVDYSPQLRQREQELVAIIEAIKHIKSSEYWKELQEKVFSKDLEKLTKRLRTERDNVEMFRLQGEVTWAEKYSLETLETQYRNELINLRNQLQ